LVEYSTKSRGAPAKPTHPFEDHLVEAAKAGGHRPWTPADGALPALYLSHGAPPLFEDPQWMAQLFGWARSMPRPTAILIVSAHW
jgi:4,5-DOPA dioxygenase extradiol